MTIDQCGDFCIACGKPLPLHNSTQYFCDEKCRDAQVKADKKKELLEDMCEREERHEKSDREIFREEAPVCPRPEDWE